MKSRKETMLLLLVLCSTSSALVQLFTPLRLSTVTSKQIKQLNNVVFPRQGRSLQSSKNEWQVIPDIWEELHRKHPSAPMLCDPIHGDTVDLTFGQFYELVTTAAAALQKLGIHAGDCISLFSENSHRWLIADQAIMKAGACNAVRGTQSSPDELRYIYQNSESKAVIVETPALLDQLFDGNADKAMTFKVINNILIFVSL